MILNFTDISTYQKLKQEEETNNLLRTLNASIHHEMIVPLKINVDLGNRLEVRVISIELQRKRIGLEIVSVL